MKRDPRPRQLVAANDQLQSTGANPRSPDGAHAFGLGQTLDGDDAPIPPMNVFANANARYCDQPTSWSSRFAGVSGTAAIFGLMLFAALFTWRSVSPIISTSQPIVVELHPLAAPPEPVREVAPGPQQVERQEAKPEPEQEVPPVPLIQIPNAASEEAEIQPQVEIIDPGPPVPQTTAPKSIAAPAANRLSSEVKADWEGQILAHLQRFRRYPPRARAARQQGTVYIRFTMNRAGKVLSSAIVKKSGSFDLDQAALDTLERAQPLPAIPEDRPDIVELTIPVDFHLRGTR